MLQPMHSKSFSFTNMQPFQVQISNLLSHGYELKGQPQLLGEVREPFPGGLERLHGGPEPGEPNKGRPPGPGCEDVEEAGPLEPLHDVEVDDVDPVFPLEGLLDCLVCSEVREFDEWADAIEDLKGREELDVMWDGRKGGVDAEAGGYEAG
uniref:Uncharacterized protein n=1 Tax=Opuntia streptacantha TaxID=393608 RepID=A0A7C9ACV4_OPUST